MLHKGIWILGLLVSSLWSQNVVMADLPVWVTQENMQDECVLTVGPGSRFLATQPKGAGYLGVINLLHNAEINAFNETVVKSQVKTFSRDNTKSGTKEKVTTSVTKIEVALHKAFDPDASRYFYDDEHQRYFVKSCPGAADARLEGVKVVYKRYRELVELSDGTEHLDSFFGVEITGKHDEKIISMTNPVKTPSTGKSKNEPKWVNELSAPNSAVGIADIYQGDLGVALLEAMLDARVNLASMISTKVSKQVQSFTDLDEGKSSEDPVDTSVSKFTTHQRLVGAYLYRLWIDEAAQLLYVELKISDDPIKVPKQSISDAELWKAFKNQTK